jgi:MFS family permease
LRGPSAAVRRPYHALLHRDFRRLGISQLISLTGSQMQMAAITWHVYLLTHSALALGFVGLTRVVPIIGFSLWGGIAADRHDRRWLMFQAQTVMLAAAAALAALTFSRHETLFLIYGLNALSAAALAFDGPARQALVPRLVPREDLPGALSLNLTIFHAAMIVGPALAGLIIAGGGVLPGGRLPQPSPVLPGHHTGGLALIYLLNALSYAPVLATLVTMKTSGKVEAAGGEHPRPLDALREGLRFVFTTPIMVWTMALDFFATFFSGSMCLLPIFADQVLKAGPAGYGILAAAPAVGALAGSLYTSVFPLPRRHGRAFLLSVAAYGAATVVFGLSRIYALTFAALAMTGLADVISTVVRQTVRQIITPDSLRGRMTSVNMIFFMGGPQLGEMEAGLVASAFASAALGATVSVVSGGLATLLVVAVVASATPVVRRYEFAGTPASPV